MIDRLRAKPGGRGITVAGGGVSVVEAGLPDSLYNLSEQYVDAEAIEIERVISADGIRVTPLVTRYAWPAELDLTARIAGLRLVERRGGWRGEPCARRSRRRVCVHGR